MKLLQEFKEFAIKGNMVDLAVGIIIGGGFGKIVTTFVEDIIMPPIGYLIGTKNISEFKILLKQGITEIDTTTRKINTVGEIAINYGKFFQTIIDFTIIAFFVFLIVKIINRYRKANEENPQPGKEEMLLTEIRDILKNKKIN